MPWIVSRLTKRWPGMEFIKVFFFFEEARGGVGVWAGAGGVS